MTRTILTYTTSVFTDSYIYINEYLLEYWPPGAGERREDITV